MLRQITMASVLGVILFTIGSANAANYCAHYVGGSRARRLRCAQSVPLRVAVRLSRQRKGEGRRALLQDRPSL